MNSITVTGIPEVMGKRTSAELSGTDHWTGYRRKSGVESPHQNASKRSYYSTLAPR